MDNQAPRSLTDHCSTTARSQLRWPAVARVIAPAVALVITLVGTSACESGGKSKATGSQPQAPADTSAATNENPAENTSAPPDKPATGRLRVLVSVDWEGAYLSEPGMAALSEFRQKHPDVPITHWVTPAYFTKPEVADTLVADMRAGFLPGDEVALHVHAWRSLAAAADVTPKLAPSFLDPDAELLEFEDGDMGYEVEVSAYNTEEFRAILRKCMEYLAPFKPRRYFRAGGALVSPPIFAALAAEGFTLDSSVMRHQDFRKAHGATEHQKKRLRATWGDVDEFALPYVIQTPHGRILEVPAAPGFGDYASAEQLIAFIDRAVAHLRAHPGRDVYVHLGFHQETAHETNDGAPRTFSGRVSAALNTLAEKHAALAVYERFSDIAARHRAGSFEAQK